jgi:hypothetical protein
VVNGLVIKAMSISQYMQTMPFADAVKVQQNAFTEAIAMNTLGSIEAREQFLQMVPRMAQIKLPDTMPQGDKQAAAQALNNLMLAARKDVVDSYPKYQEDVRMLSLYGLFFNGIGDGVSADEVLTKGHVIAPNKQLLTYDLIRAKLLQQKFGEAYALGRETYDLDIKCQNAQKWFLISAAYAGAYKEARDYSLSKGQAVTSDPDVIAGLITTNQRSLAIQLLEEIKKEKPEEAAAIDAYIKQLLAPNN